MRRGLAGLRVIVTRAADGTDELCRLLRERGARPIEIPAIQIIPPADWRPLDRAIERLDSYDLLLFTSRNGVRFFAGRLRDRPVPAIPVAAVGEKTASALRKLGIRDPIVPPRPGAAEELAGELLRRFPDLKRRKILFPRAEKAREVLGEALRSAGADLEIVVAYRTLPVPGATERLAAAMAERPDWITFGSASAVEALLDRPRADLFRGVKVAAIGRVVAEALRSRGVLADAVPSVPTFGALVEAMAELG